MRFKFELRVVEERMALAMVVVGVVFKEEEEERGGAATAPFPLSATLVEVVDEAAMEDANMS